MTESVLFVCLGNICRSPAAEAVFASRTGKLGISVDSAGTGNWHVGKPPHPPMIKAAQRRGIVMNHLRARQFTHDDFERFDLIVGMDNSNIEAIEALRPRRSQVSVRKLLSFGGPHPTPDVPDPYFTGDYEAALDLIEVGVAGLIDDIIAQKQKVKG